MSRHTLRNLGYTDKKLVPKPVVGFYDFRSNICKFQLKPVNKLHTNKKKNKTYFQSCFNVNLISQFL